MSATFSFQVSLFCSLSLSLSLPLSLSLDVSPFLYLRLLLYLSMSLGVSDFFFCVGVLLYIASSMLLIPLLYVVRAFAQPASCFSVLFVCVYI